MAKLPHLGTGALGEQAAKAALRNVEQHGPTRRRLNSLMGNMRIWIQVPLASQAAALIYFRRENNQHLHESDWRSLSVT
jgi:hypothetical protein